MNEQGDISLGLFSDSQICKEAREYLNKRYATPTMLVEKEHVRYFLAVNKPEQMIWAIR